MTTHPATDRTDLPEMRVPPLTRADWLLTAGVLVIALAWCWWTSRGAVSVTYDSFRDMAWSRAMLLGRWWQDPVLAGEPPWYPPGGPWLTAVICRLTGADVATVQTASALWWNALIPPAVFLVVRTTLDRATAVVSIPCLVLGSLWWMTHLAAPMPSIQGLLPQLIAIALFVGATRSRRWWFPAGGAGLTLGATFWVHPLCAAMGAVAVVGLGVSWMLRRSSNESRTPIAAVALAGAVALLTSWPALALQLGLERLNTVPMRYTAPELFNPDFALQWHAPLLLPLAALGLWCLWRRPAAGWVLPILALGLAGQLPVIVEALGLGSPFRLLPHEFQWHTQVATAVLAACGITAVAALVAGRLRRLQVPDVAWSALIAIAVLSSSLWFVPLAGSYQVDLGEFERRRGPLAEWIRRAVPPDAVFAADPHHCLLTVAGLTGRRCVAVPPGFMNPSVAPGHREAVLTTILTTKDDETFLAAMHTAGATHLLVIVDAPGSAALARRAASSPSLRLGFSSADGRQLVFQVPSEPPQNRPPRTQMFYN
jgi:hypothetical protein